MQCWEDGATATWMYRELSYECISGSGRARGSITRRSNAEDVGRAGLASAQGLVLNNQCDTQCGVLLEHNPR